jgi:hypothetical protein
LQQSFGLCGYIRVPINQWLPVAAVLMKLDLVILANAKEINCFKANYDVNSRLSKLDVGKSLLLASSLVNHSCDANMYPVWYGTTVVFRARRPISKGEQLTCSYVPPATSFDYERRQDILLQLYKFKCRYDPEWSNFCLKVKIKIIFYSCSACVGLLPTRDRLPLYPERRKLRQWLIDAGFDKTSSSTLMSLCHCKHPATKQMLPKLLSILKLCHGSDQKATQLYFNLQKSIQNHYRTEGNCLFLGAAKEILSGAGEILEQIYSTATAELHHSKSAAKS